MTGENNLAALLRGMKPELFAEIYGFGVVVEGQVVPRCFAQISEPEGITVIATSAALRLQGIESAGEWARISLTVHSDLQAVGLTATLATALAAQGISANVVAGYYHDHFFVQWDRRADAMAILHGLSHV